MVIERKDSSLGIPERDATFAYNEYSPQDKHSRKNSSILDLQ
jgi:hypothetical protein